MVRFRKPLSVLSVAAVAITGCTATDQSPTPTIEPAGYSVYVVPTGGSAVAPQLVYPNAPAALTPVSTIDSPEVFHGGVVFTANITKLQYVFVDFLGTSAPSPYSNLTPASTAETTPPLSGATFIFVATNLEDTYPLGKYAVNFRFLTCTYADGSMCSLGGIQSGTTKFYVGLQQA
jgi:hypothetical protein